MADPSPVGAIRAGLRAAADPARAPQMQAYMKSAMPYLGVRLPQVRIVVRDCVRGAFPASADELKRTVRALWDAATYREERYAATALLAMPAARPLRHAGQLALLRDLIVDGAWWDHVDELAHRVGELLLAFPDEVRPPVMAWRTDPDRWLRRVSIICQLGFKDRTDRDLLTAAVDANTSDPDFFIRKAIGWALREFARTDPDWVRGFVAARELSPLSRREALKHLG